MIHYTQEGAYLKLGLNFRFTAGGFTAIWAWYDIAARTLTLRRFRLRYHIRPWVLRGVTRHNVVQGYLDQHDLDVVSREVLRDMRAVEDFDKRFSDRQTYVGRA